MTDKPMSEAELKEIEELLEKSIVVVGKTPKGSDIIDTNDMDIQTLACRDVPRLVVEVRRQRRKRIEERAYRNMFNPTRKEHWKHTVKKTEGNGYVDYTPLPNVEQAEAEIKKEDLHGD